MERPPQDVMQYIVEIEEAAEDVLADKHQLVELDKRRQSTRQAVRCLQKDKETKKSWVCFGNMFLKIPRENAIKLLKKDYDKLDTEHSEVRINLKSKVAKLRDLEHKEELKGFNLQPLSKTELQAVSNLLNRQFVAKMAAKDGVTQYILMPADGRSSSRIPLSEERVKNVAEKIKQITQDTVDEENIRHVVSEACSLALAASRESKLLKPLIKALNHLEKMSDVSRSVFRDTLIANHLVCQDDDCRLSLEYLQFWSQLIEGTKVGKDVVGQYFMDRYLDATYTIKHLVKGQLGSDIASDKLTGKHTVADKSSENDVPRLSTENQSLLHASIKFLIQLYQNFRTDLSRRINSTTNDTPDGDMTDAKKLLVSLLKCPSVSKDCIFLAATCLSFHLSYHYNKAATMQEFLDIYSIFNMLEINHSEQPDIVRISDSSYLTQCMVLMSTHSYDLLARIALVNGMLACAERAHLWQIVSGSDREIQDNQQGATSEQDTDSISMTLFQWLFNETVDLCRRGEWQFHAFSLLQLWYNKATKYAEEHLTHKEDLFGLDSGVLKATLDLVWTQMDSPVDGVRECITQVYKMALALHVNAPSENKDLSAESDKKETSSGIILSEILEKALQMSWHVKSKHVLVSGLMTYFPMSYILKKEPHLGASLLDCIM